MFFQTIYQVLYAKAPIIRIEQLKSEIELDISSRNSTPSEEPATRNTRLLAMYRRKNIRSTKIFKVFKRVIRGTRVSLASTSGISSYSYSILFYFFHRNILSSSTPVHTKHSLQSRENIRLTNIAYLTTFFIMII